MEEVADDFEGVTAIFENRNDLFDGAQCGADVRVFMDAAAIMEADNASGSNPGDDVASDTLSSPAPVVPDYRPHHTEE